MVSVIRKVGIIAFLAPVIPSRYDSPVIRAGTAAAADSRVQIQHRHFHVTGAFCELTPLGISLGAARRSAAIIRVVSPYTTR